MLDTQTLNELVQREISSQVQRAVDQALSQDEWLTTIQERIVSAVQDRLIGRFRNVEQVPGLVDVVTQGVTELFDHGRIPGIHEYVDRDKIQRGLDAAVQQLVQASIDNLVLDPQWLEKIQTIVDGNMSSLVTRHLSMIDLQQAISTTVSANMDQWIERLASSTRRLGLQDIAQQTELTVMDGAVVVERNLVASDLVVAHTASVQGALMVQDLAVVGSVNVDNPSWSGVADRASDLALEKLTPEWRQGLVQEVLALARESGIDFDSVTLGGEPLVSSGHLNANIRHSRLESVGVLENLTTVGTVKLNNTVTVLPRRLGINTQEPDMALTVWDEEVKVITGKYSQDRAYIGTGRRQSLALGIDRNIALEIDADGLVTVQRLRVDRWRISYDRDIPGYSGTRGDIVFNHDPRPDSAFAWVCLGGFRWQPVRSA